MEVEKWFSPRQVAELEGCSVTSVYQRLSAGEYEARKDGIKTLIPASSIAARRERLPKAEYGSARALKVFSRARPRHERRRHVPDPNCD
jgi:hypothetical protein